MNRPLTFIKNFCRDKKFWVLYTNNFEFLLFLLPDTILGGSGVRHRTSLDRETRGENGEKRRVPDGVGVTGGNPENLVWSNQDRAHETWPKRKRDPGRKDREMFRTENNKYRVRFTVEKCFRKELSVVEVIGDQESSRVKILTKKKDRKWRCTFIDYTNIR